MGRLDCQSNIRIPGELKRRLIASAAEGRRSVNAEIVRRLELSFGPHLSSGSSSEPAATEASVRTALAGVAMHGLLANPAFMETNGPLTPLGETAVVFADQLLAELGKDKTR